MTRKLIARGVFSALLLGVLSGCSSMTGWSVRSYQGPLPMEDFRYLNAEAYGTPTPESAP